MEEKDYLQTRFWEAKRKANEVTCQLGEVDINVIRMAKMKEYRLFRACHGKKESYTTGFVKYGFFLARGYLEKMFPEDNFLELIYMAEAI